LLYEAPDLIKEIGGRRSPGRLGERVACVVVPDYEKNEGQQIRASRQD